MSAEEKSIPPADSPWIGPALLLLIATFLATFTVQILCEESALATSFMSPPTWQRVVQTILGGTFQEGMPNTDGVPTLEARVSARRCLLGVIFLQVLMLLPALTVPRWRRRMTPELMGRLAWWQLFFGTWGILWTGVWIAQIVPLAQLLQTILVFWVSLALAGVFYELWKLFRTEPVSPSDTPSEVIPSEACSLAENRWLWGMMAVYVLIFTAMNWGLWFNLRLPHGDSAMYEEHLWNFWHGKGFRSYLDQGLFLGEHIQFVHLFLVPLHWIWPSHLLLELCESLALATGAIPIYWMVQRTTHSNRAAALLSLTYLLYFPMQFLDIAIDLKTFRPMAFGIPLVLFAVDQLERQRYGAASLFLMFALTCKEDYSITVFSIGLTLLARWLWWVSQNRSRGQKISRLLWTLPESRLWQWGAAYLMFGPIYLLSALQLIRWFRSGVEVHYAGYFTKFGRSTSEIIWTMLTNPGLLIGELATLSTLVYALAMLVPLGFLPLLSPLRLLSCLPIFVLLCLNELAQDPRHHFHAPLVPLLFWAASAGLGEFSKTVRKPEEVRVSWAENRSRWAVCCALATGLWFSLSPLGVAFWDPHSVWNGKTLYWPNERAWMFARIQNLIPQEARVASTDYVHPRYTHHERSYDYSNYARKVSGNTLNVPEDTDYIVIDTRHPYSSIQTPAQVRELQEQPDQWELLPDTTEGYFIVLKRRPTKTP